MSSSASSPRVRVGLTVVAVYVVVVAATLTFTGRRVLPLFEGIGPPPAYQWVHPPPELANGNVTPKPSTTDIAATAATTKAAAAFTADGQCVVNFSVGAFSPHDRDITVRATITPLDPAALGPLPPGSAADGNAYRIELTYQPSNTPVGALAVAGDVFLTIPHDATDLLYSADGRTWTTVPHTGVSSGSAVGATFSRPGWYLAVAPPTAPSAPRKNGFGAAAIAVLVAVLAVVLVVTPFGLRSIRRRTRPRRSR